MNFRIEKTVIIKHGETEKNTKTVVVINSEAGTVYDEIDLVLDHLALDHVGNDSNEQGEVNVSGHTTNPPETWQGLALEFENMLMEDRNSFRELFNNKGKYFRVEKPAVIEQ